MKWRDRVAVLAFSPYLGGDFDHHHSIRGGHDTDRIAGLCRQSHQRRVMVNPRHRVFTSNGQLRPVEGIDLAHQPHLPAGIDVLRLSIDLRHQRVAFVHRIERRHETLKIVGQVNRNLHEAVQVEQGCLLDGFIHRFIRFDNFR